MKNCATGSFLDVPVPASELARLIHDLLLDPTLDITPPGPVVIERTLTGILIRTTRGTFDVAYRSVFKLARELAD